jgi:hypothetical protein
VRDHHRFLIAQHLTHRDFLEEQIAVFDHQIAQLIDTQSACEPGCGPTHSCCEPYLDLGANYLEKRQQDRLLQRLCHRATQLGYHLALTPIPQPIT